MRAAKLFEHKLHVER